MSNWTWPQRLSALAALILITLMVVDAAHLYRQEAVNARIRSDEPQTLTPSDPPEVVHAEALRQGHAGNTRQAHDLYARVALGKGHDLRLRAEYNHANLLMREAMDMRAENDAEAGRALPLLELAKESYRKVLRETPDSWDARYNLERALRLAPEPPELDPSEGPAPSHRERAPTTMRGDTLGLP